MFKEIFLGRAALIPESLELIGIDALTFAFQLPLKHSRNGEIHVVAAKQNVFANRHPFERQVAVFVGDGDQAEIRGSSTDVAHQHEVTHFDSPAPALPLALQPGVEGRLWLFQ